MKIVANLFKYTLIVNLLLATYPLYFDKTITNLDINQYNLPEKPLSEIYIPLPKKYQEPVKKQLRKRPNYIEVE